MCACTQSATDCVIVTSVVSLRMYHTPNLNTAKFPAPNITIMSFILLCMYTICVQCTSEGDITKKKREKIKTTMTTRKKKHKSTNGEKTQLCV